METCINQTDLTVLWMLVGVVMTALWGSARRRWIRSRRLLSELYTIFTHSLENRAYYDKWVRDWPEIKARWEK